MKEYRVGLIGCGNISGIYLSNLTGRLKNARIVACADLLPGKAEICARQYGISAIEPDKLLKSGDIDVVLNLTTPPEHANISIRALQNGKHVYCEKTLALTLKDADEILDAAAKNNLVAGCAPDTFLGSGIQAAAGALRGNAAGRPVAASAFMVCRGHERWHPNPAFYYDKLAGPMFDMGPYYITALVCLLGSVKSVVSAGSRAFGERIITSQPLYGQKIKVQTDTHYSISLMFENDVVATMMMSFDIWAANLPYIEIYGESGMVSCPDPNTFAGPVTVREKDASISSVIRETSPFNTDSRGLGLAEMCSALHAGKEPRASGMLARHVLDVIVSTIRSAEEGRMIECAPFERQPEPLTAKDAAALLN